MKKKTGITRPRPEGGVKSPRSIGPRRFSPPLREQNVLRMTLKIRAQVV